jgi:hypothetical protein
MCTLVVFQSGAQQMQAPWQLSIAVAENLSFTSSPMSLLISARK